MAEIREHTRGQYKAVPIELTDEQREQIAALIEETGNAGVTAVITFNADLKSKTIAPATILAGAAV